MIMANPELLREMRDGNRFDLNFAQLFIKLLSHPQGKYSSTEEETNEECQGGIGRIG